VKMSVRSRPTFQLQAGQPPPSGGLILGVGFDLVFLDLIPQVGDAEGEAEQDRARGELVLSVNRLAPGVAVPDQDGDGLFLGFRRSITRGGRRQSILPAWSDGSVADAGDASHGDWRRSGWGLTGAARADRRLSRLPVGPEGAEAGRPTPAGAARGREDGDGLTIIKNPLLAPQGLAMPHLNRG